MNQTTFRHSTRSLAPSGARAALIALALVLLCGCKTGGGEDENRHPLVDVCSMGNLDNCYAAAEKMEAGGVEERRAALNAFQFGCLMEHAPSCSGLARMYGDATGEVSDRRVLEALQSACKGGDGDSCVQLGRRMETESARAMFERACEGGSGAGCHELAEIERRGWRIPGKLQRAVELDEKACELGSIDGCVAAGQAYLFGSGVAQDDSRGFELLEPTCNEQTGGGCEMLAKMYEDGIGVSANAEKASQYRALAEQHTAAVVADSPGTAFLVFVDACSQGNLLGCFNAGWFLAEGVEVERNISTSRELFDQACTGGLQAACDRWKKIEPINDSTPIPNSASAETSEPDTAGGEGAP